MAPSNLVSIIIPVFNGSDFMQQAIDSALAQSWRQVEVIVVDDGSTDDGKTRRIAESYGDRIRLVTKPNGGVATALNAGIAAMRGSWFSWLSHDDFYHPRKIEAQMEALAQSDGAAIAFGDYHVVDEGGAPLGTVAATQGFEPDRPLWAVLEGRLNGCAMLIRRDILVEAGGFEPGLPTTQDYELWFRLLRRHPMIAAPGAFVSHRSHGAQGSRQARHLEEAGMLWAEMLGRLTPEEMRRHGGSERGFLLRVRGFLERGAYAGGTAAADRLLRALPRQTLGLVWIGAGPATPAAAMAAITEAGFTPAGCVVVDASPDAAISLALTHRLAPGTHRVRLGLEVAFADILQAACTLADAQMVLLVDSATSLEPAHWRHDAEAMAAGGFDGWLPNRRERGPGGILPAAFRGALLRGEALRAAFARCEALGHGDPALALGLVARLGCGEPPVAPAVGDTPAPTPRPMAVPRTAPPPPPWLATTRPGALLLAVAMRLQRGAIGVITRLFRARGLVEPRAYLAAYPDLVPGRTDPTLHYLRHGWREGRDPRPNLVEAAPVREAGVATAPATLPAEPPLSAAEGLPSHLIFLPCLDGRAARHALLLGDLLRRKGRRPLYAWGIEGRELVLSFTAPGEGRFRYSWPDAQAEAMRWLAEQSPAGAEVLGTAGLEQTVLPVLEGLKLPYDLTFLEEDPAASWPAPAQAPGLHPIVALGARRLAPSRYWAARVQARLGGVAVQAALPPEATPPERFRATLPEVSPQRPTRVLLLGQLGEAEGRDTVLAVALAARRQQLPLEFHVLGDCVPAISPADQVAAGLHVHGPCRRETLTSCVMAIGADLAWFPTRQAEGYSASLSDAMLLGLPVLATPCGDHLERLAGRPGSWVMPAETPPMGWLERLVALRASGFTLPSEIAPPEGLGPLLVDYYRCHFPPQPVG